MTSYYQNKSFYKRRKQQRRFLLGLTTLIIVSLLAVGFFVYDQYRQTMASTTSSAATTPTNATISSETELYTTQFFQFRANNKWKAIANDTKTGYYVYRQFNGPLVEQELIITVDSNAPDILSSEQTTRVLPVAVSEQGFLEPQGTISPHCKTAVKAGDKSQQLVKMLNTTFPCNPDGTNFKVAVGEVGKTSNITLKRPGGGSSTYRFSYMDVSASPTGRELPKIIETFEAR